MNSLVIQGGRPLHGEVQVSGAKNAALPILAATLLTEEPCVIHRTPRLRDTTFMVEILGKLGAKARFRGDTVKVEAPHIKGFGHYDLIRKMRGSICILGPLLARLGQARVSLPGGCIIGSRPVDLHLKGLRALGAKIEIEGGYVCARARRLHGANIFLGGKAGPTVLGTANVMMAAVLARGRTVIQSAACEPEVVDLADFLIAMGARISGSGSPTITIDGVDKLHGAEHEVIPDRIEAATFAIAAAAAGGEVELRGSRPEHYHAVIDKLEEIGAEVVCGPNRVLVRRTDGLRPVDVTTQPYAGFPTDAQAQLTALLARAEGISIVTERIFESRFMHVSELARLGADITIEGPSAVIKGGTRLSGAPVMASDLRASAALVIAGLIARGETRIKRIYHLERGYCEIDEKLRRLGARVRKGRA